MPTYEYACGACGETCEFFQGIKENPKRKCPTCGRFKLKRQIGKGGAVLFRKGVGGFHSKDYGCSEGND